MSTKQADKAKKRVKRGGSAAWNRDRMNETHRKGKRGSKKQVRRASRREGKQSAIGDLDLVEVAISPVDYKQCQAMKKGGSFMTLGPRPWFRCENKPLVVATEKKRGKDGQRGKMSLCAECLSVFKKVNPGGATFKLID